MFLRILILQLMLSLQIATVQAQDALTPAEQAEFKALIKKAEEGDAKSQHFMGLIYLKGIPGIPVNFTKSKEWFEKSAIAGDALSMYNLGLLHSYGKGVAFSNENAYVMIALSARFKVEAAKTKQIVFAKLVPPAELPKLDAKVEAWQLNTPLPLTTPKGPF